MPPAPGQPSVFEPSIVTGIKKSGNCRKVPDFKGFWAVFTKMCLYPFASWDFNLTVNAVVYHALKFRTIIDAGSAGKIHINISHTPLRQTVNLMRQRRNLHSHTVELRRQAGADASVNAHRFVPHIILANCIFSIRCTFFSGMWTSAGRHIKNDCDVVFSLIDFSPCSNSIIH